MSNREFYAGVTVVPDAASPSATTCPRDPGRRRRRGRHRRRNLVAGLYPAEQADPEGHRAAFRALVQLRPVAAKQIPFLLK